ncbi:MAG: hypothetical protein K2Y18_07860 [Alphaproteobacteria bacterium]|jgi:bacteriocin-like protein|nr:hypothetical protein [Alphaproteobacteria bacterium]
MKTNLYTELSEKQMESVVGGGFHTYNNSPGYGGGGGSTTVASTPTRVNNFYGPTYITNNNISIINISNNTIYGSIDIGVFQSIEM